MLLQGLSDNKLGNEGAKHLCRMLRVNGGLRKFNLKGSVFCALVSYSLTLHWYRLK